MVKSIILSLALVIGARVHAQAPAPCDMVILVKPAQGLEFRNSIRAQWKAGTSFERLEVNSDLVRPTLVRGGSLLAEQLKTDFFRVHERERNYAIAVQSAIRTALASPRVNYRWLHRITIHLSTVLAFPESKEEERSFFMQGGTHPYVGTFQLQLLGPVSDLPNIAWGITRQKLVNLDELLAGSLPHEVGYPTYLSHAPDEHNLMVALGIRPIGMLEGKVRGYDSRSFTGHDYSHMWVDLRKRLEIAKPVGPREGLLEGLPLIASTPNESESFYWDFFAAVNKEKDVKLRKMIHLVWFNIFHEAGVPINRNNLHAMLIHKKKSENFIFSEQFKFEYEDVVQDFLSTVPESERPSNYTVQEADTLWQSAVEWLEGFALKRRGRLQP